MTPEQILWQSVLLKAITDAAAINPAGDENKRAKTDADNWLRGGGRDFRRVCDFAGFDPDFIREKYIAGKINVVTRLVKGTTE